MKKTFTLILSLALFNLVSCHKAASPKVDKPEGMNMKEDGGAAAYSQKPASTVGDMITPDQEKAFPVAQRSSLHVLGGGVRGMGLLVKYDDAQPRQFLIARRMATPDKEPFNPSALGKIIDPKGNLAAVEDFTDQTRELEVRTVSIPYGMAGIWRISFVGGRRGDVIELRAPKTDVWGVRGEMALTLSDTTPNPAYFWIPPTSKRILLGLETSDPQGTVIQNRDGSAVLAEPEKDPATPLSRAARLVIEQVNAGTVSRVVFGEKFKGAFVFEGVPTLLCPTPEAAEALRGGTVESHGVYVSGPLQARARNWMVEHAAKLNRAPDLHWPTSVPDDAIVKPSDIIAYGEYGGLNGIANTIEAQNANLDPSNPCFGIQTPKDTPFTDEKGNTWVNYLHPAYGKIAMFMPASLASLYAYESKWNPVYRSPDILERATLAGFYHIESLQGDDLIRESGDLFRGRYPLIHAFFTYPTMALAFQLLKDDLKPDAREIWREALIAMGDKVADHQAYESNQWTHMMEGHLITYITTGEKRFLRNFERQMTAFMDNWYGPNSKFGLHEAGYFMEEFGPDGNYERLNLICVVHSYNEYKKLKEANPIVVEKMKKGIQRNLEFKSYFWLPQPNGTLHSPNAMNHRTEGVIWDNAYPGDLMSMEEFPLGASRFKLSVEPEKGLGVCGNFAYVANNPEWAKRVLKQYVANGPKAAPAMEAGYWVSHIAPVYQSGKMAQPALLPCQQVDFSKSLPGIEAWKHGAFFGMVFYEVAGSERVPRGFLGGGPVVLWTEKVGSFLASVAPEKPGHDVDDASKLTFSSVYGEDLQGRLLSSGRERSKIQITEPGRKFAITSTQGGDFFESLEWNYAITNESIVLTVQMKAKQPLKSAFLNLPITQLVPNAKAVLVSPSRLEYSVEGAKVIIEWPSSSVGQLLPSIKPNIKRLVVPLVDNQPLQVKIYQELKQ